MFKVVVRAYPKEGKIYVRAFEPSQRSYRIVYHKKDGVGISLGRLDLDGTYLHKFTREEPDCVIMQYKVKTLKEVKDIALTEHLLK